METEELKKLLTPFLCKDKIRVGSAHDGGYILPSSAIKKADVLLSFGVSTNIDFEKEMAALHPVMKIYMYDPFIGAFLDIKRLILRLTGRRTPAHLPVNLPLNPNYKKPGLLSDAITRFIHWWKFYKFTDKKNIHFNKIGLRDYSDKMFTSFPEMFSKPFLKDKTNIILKMDIEGDEYKVYKQMADYLPKLDVVLLEVHYITDQWRELINILRLFNSAGLHLFHIHGNNSDALIENTTIPNTLELSFARAPYTEPVYDNGIYPDEKLDTATDPRYEDYKLDFLNSRKANLT